MDRSLVRKLLEDHLVSGAWKPGEEVGVRIDQTLTQDATGTMAYLQFESLGVDRVRTELSVSYVDHNTLQAGFENADDHAYLQGAARRYGVRFSRAGNGICHQVHLERFGVPGKTLLGSDSHTPTAGGLGMLAVGAGGLDVALAMAGRPFYLACPRVVCIRLENALRPWVSAKDVALKALEIFGTRGNVDTVFEYSGPGLSSLSVPDRATIANMGAECGVTATVFPSDGRTREYLRAQGREGDWRPLSADPGAEYDREASIDLAALEPLAALPHSPGNVKPVREIAGLKVDQVCIGSCTNSSYRDLAVTASVLAGRTVHPGVGLVIAPGSRQVVETALRDGFFSSLVASGARIAECACGFCIGNGHAPGSGAVSLRTSNRNFEGRSGTRDARVYLVSPETAAASAIRGVIADPRDLGLEYPRVSIPSSFVVNDSFVLDPVGEEEARETRIPRGPNIGSPPSGAPFPESLSAVAAIKLGDRITTDHILPAGVRLKYRSNIPAYSDFVFEGVDPDFARRAAFNRDSGLANVIVAGKSYGQGSSREHAAICPAFLGVRAVLALSFERIHAANLVNFGVLPLVFLDEGDYERIEAGDRLEMGGVRGAVEAGRNARIRNATKGFEMEAAVNLSPRQRSLLLAGGALAKTAGKGRTRSEA